MQPQSACGINQGSEHGDAGAVSLSTSSSSHLWQPVFFFWYHIPCGSRANTNLRSPGLPTCTKRGASRQSGPDKVSPRHFTRAVTTSCAGLRARSLSLARFQACALLRSRAR